VIKVKTRYQIFCLGGHSNRQLLTAALPEALIKTSVTDLTQLETGLPFEIKKAVTCNLYFDKDQWCLPVLLWVEAKGNELFDSLPFTPWQESVTLEEPQLWTSINQQINSLLGRNNICAIVGCKEGSQRFTPEVQEQAFQAGRMAVLTGYSVLTGGLSGVMTKAAQGADSLSSTTIGILPGTEKAAANKYIRNVLPSGIGIARNYQIALACDVMIAVNGGRGTMEEMCFALDFERPVVSWNSWDLDGVHKAAGEEDIFQFLVEQKEKLILKLFDEINSGSE